MSAPHADRGLVDSLYAHGAIDRAGRDAALAMLLPGRAWGAWSARVASTLGGVLVLCGIVYFFAFNWASLAPFAKLGIVEAGIVACISLAVWRGLERAAGRFGIGAASVLVGVFLAVFGQIYQTGADAWQLFATWAVLVAPWTLLARSLGCWMLWLVIADAALSLWWEQAAPERVTDALSVWIVLAIAGAAALAARESTAARGASWLQPLWPRWIVGVSTIAFAAVPMATLAADPEDANVAAVSAAAAGLAIHAGVFAAYRGRRHDVAMLGAGVLSLAVVVDVLVFRILFEIADGAEALALLVGAGLTLALFAGAVAALRRLVRTSNADGASER